METRCAESLKDEFTHPKMSRSGTIQRERLDSELEGIARHTYQVVGHLVKSTYGQWELEFLPDQNPEQELFRWLAISDAFEVAVDERPDLDEKAILGDLIHVAVGGPSRYGLKETYLAVNHRWTFSAELALA